MLAERGIEGIRVLQGFLALAKRYPASAIDEASKTALDANAFRLRPLRELLKRHEQQPHIPFAEEHEIIRPLHEYQQMLNASFTPTEERKNS